MATLEFLASFATIIGIFLYNKRNYWAPMVYSSACVLWICYSIKTAMYFYLIMNVMLWLITLYNLSDYTENTRLKKEEIDE